MDSPPRYILTLDQKKKKKKQITELLLLSRPCVTPHNLPPPLLTQNPMTGWTERGKTHALLSRSPLSPTAVEKIRQHGISIVFQGFEAPTSRPGTKKKLCCVPVMQRASHVVSLLTLRSHQVSPERIRSPLSQRAHGGSEVRGHTARRGRARLSSFKDRRRWLRKKPTLLVPTPLHL